MKEKLSILRKQITSNDVGTDAFFPCYNSDLEFMKRCKPGRQILCSTRRSRNPDHHKLIFAIAKCVIANTHEDSIWSKVTPYDLIKAIMFAEGIVDIYFNLDGTTRAEPKRINFESMSENEFQPVSDAMFKWGAKMLDIGVGELRLNYIEYL